MVIGVIGCGYRIKQILKSLLVINPDHKILGICDLKKRAIEDYKKTFGEDIEVYDDYNILLKNKDISWVLIGSINSAHKDQIMACFNSEKNVFSEKPLAISISDCLEIKKLFKQKNLKFLISYPLRYSPYYKKINEIIAEGKIGKIISMEFNETLSFTHGSFIMNDWRRFEKYSGGHLLEKCCHDMDIANWITRNIPKKVASFGDLNFFKFENSEFYDNIKDKENFKFDEKIISNPFTSEKDILDNQVVIIEYYNGVRATFHTNCSSAIPERRTYICGTKGTIRADVLTGKIEINFHDSSKEKIEIIDEGSKVGHGDGDQFLVQDLDKAITQGIIPKTSMDDAIKSAVTCIAIEESRKENRIVNLDPIWDRISIIR